MKKILCVLCAAILFASCGTVIYMAPMPDAPLLEEKGDVRVSVEAQMPACLLPLTLNADATYALTDHIGITAGGNYMQPEYYYMQAGGGYYTHLAGHQVVEAYLTAGKGLQINRPTDVTGQSIDDIYTRLDYQQYCIQADYGLSNLTKAHIDLGVALRGGLMAYHLYSTKSGALQIDKDGFSPIVEPMLFFRIGAKPVRLQLEVGYTSFQPASAFTSYFVLPKLNATLGLSFNF